MAKTLSNAATGAGLIDTLLASARWNESTITFGFTSSTASYGANYGVGETTKGFQALTAPQMAAVKDALAAWGELINLKIVETSGDGADIRVAASSAPTTAWAYTPSDSGLGGDVWLGTSKGYFSNPVDGNYGKMTIIHELGHALGLGHPHSPVFGVGSGNYVADDGADNAQCPCCGGAIHSDGQGVATGNVADFGGDASSSTVDAMAYTVMSYSSYAGDGRRGYTNGTWDYAQSPMARDIAAIQNLYGANYQTRSGDTVYSWSPTSGEKFINGVGQGAPGGNKVFEAIWDGGGRDTIDLSKYGSNLSIDLAPGGWVNFGNSQVANLGAGQTAPGNVAMSYLFEGNQRSLIENAVGGSGNDVIKGNAANNVLVGGAGDDRIEGLAGQNILAGGTIGKELSYVGLDRAAYISVLPTVGTNDGSDVLIGGDGNDIFVAGSGNDTVKGGAGVNTLIIDGDLASIKITGNASELVFTYAGGKTAATDIDYVATKDGIFAIAGSDALIDTSKISAQKENISLLYNAGLDRDIDTSGLAFWLGQLGNGGSLSNLASGIINAAEFRDKFGNPQAMSDGDFVQVLYKNVLARAGETSGVDYWTKYISGGHSRADVLVNFSLSDENRAATAANATAPTDSGVQLVAITQNEWAHVWA